MTQTYLPLPFPEADPVALLWTAIVLLLLVFGAVAVQYRRRRAYRRAGIAAEWRSAERIMREKEFSKEEKALLRSLIERRLPQAPLLVVTTCRSFDACVDAEMKALADSDEHHFREAGIQLREIRVRLDLDYVPYGQRIYSTRALTVGQVIWISPASIEPPLWVKGSVLAVDEAYFHVTARDERAGAMPSFAQGDEARCHLWREDDARYEFKTVVAYSEGAPQTWSLRHTSDLHRVQARDFYRVRCNQETTIGVLASWTKTNESEDPGERRVLTRIRGRISSLSAGGLALVTQHAVRTPTLLRVAIELPAEAPFEVEANTVYVDPLSGGRYLVRAEFVGISEEKRDVIARYVLRRQMPHGAPPAPPRTSPTPGQESPTSAPTPPERPDAPGGAPTIRE